MAKQLLFYFLTKRAVQYKREFLNLYKPNFLPHFLLCIRRRTGSVLLLLVLSISVAKSQVTVSGKVTDSLSHQPIPYATVTLKNNKKEDIVSLSDKDGRFAIKNVSTGKHTISVSIFNYSRIEKSFTVSSEDTVFYLGDIHMKLNKKQLETVEVTAQNLISQEVDRIKYNVKEDPQRENASTLDILRKVPLLTIDPNGNIKYQGGTKFLILLDNKPSNVLLQNPSDFLQNLPASKIETIDVITSPSGQYLAEGVSGVINITTTKRKETGYEGSVSAVYRTPAGGPSIGVSQTLKIGKVSLSPYLSFTRYHIPSTETALNRRDEHSTLRQTGTKESDQQSGIISADLIYDIDTLNVLSGRFGYYTLKNEHIANLFNSLTSFEETGNRDSNIKNTENNKIGESEVAVDYQRTYANDPNKILTLSYLFANSRENINNNIRTASPPPEENVSEYHQKNIFTQKQNSIQADLSMDINKTRMNSGIKGVSRLGESNFLTVSSKEDDGAENGRAEPGFFKSDLYMLLFYNSYQFKLQNFEFMTGYRFEYSKTIADFSTESPKVKKQYLNLLPSLTVNYPLSENKNLKLIFNQMVKRPNISYLNPFTNSLNPNLLVKGNPHLEPVKTNSINFQFSQMKTGSLILGLLYDFSHNEIQQIMSEGDTAGIYHLTYGNIGKSNKAGFTASYNAALNNSINASFSGNLKYVHLKGETATDAFQNSGWTGDLNMSLNYMLSDNFYLVGNFSYTTPSFHLQGKTTSYPYYVFQAAKSMFNNKLSLTASMINPFKRYQLLKTSYSENGAVQEVRDQVHYRVFNFQLTWKFGGLKQQLNKVRKTIENDDELSVEK